MLRINYKKVILFTLIFVVTITGVGWALPVTVYFSDQSTSSTPSFTQGDLTVSSPQGDLYFLNHRGVGVNNSGLSQGETIVFDFAQLASGYRLDVPFATGVTFELEAFDAHGTSLGLRQLQTPNYIPAYSLFGNPLISSLRVTNIKDQHTRDPAIRFIQYYPEPLPNPIPEPGTWMLLGLGVPAVLVFGRRRRKMRK